MQTLYYTTKSFIRHQDNVVDLSEYRRRLAQAVQVQDLEEEGDPAPQAQAEPRRSRRSHTGRASRGALFLYGCASLGVVVMTVIFTLRVLAL